jgi:hypothetical protein
MRAASAKIAGECLSDLFVAWISRLEEERSGLHDHAVDAITTLHRLFVDERLLHGMRLLGGAEPFQRDHIAAANRRQRSNAGPHRVTVDVDRAGAALAETTSKSRTMQAKVVTQCIEERHIRIVDRDFGGLSVDVESD